MVVNVTQIKSGITINLNVTVKPLKSIMLAKKIIFGILLHVLVKNGKYLGSIIDDSVIMCGETIKGTRTIPTKITSSETTSTKSVPTKSTSTEITSTQIVPTKVISTNWYALLNNLLTNIALLIGVGIYYYQLKHRSKQKNLSSYQDSNNSK